MQLEENDPLRYDRWIEHALRTVIRRALLYAADNGLPGDHHFYVTFRTDTPEVVMPDYLRAQHAEEMTIVLQHQFDDLEVDEDGFAVTLRFGGKPERLQVPLIHVTAFTDPAVNFGLQLKMADAAEEGEAPEAGETPEAAPPLGAEILEHPADNAAAAAEGTVDEESEDEEERKAGEVIALDAFRKK